MAKYPTTERVTAGKLAVGDLILIKNGASNGLIHDGPYKDWVPFEPGLWTVDGIASQLVQRLSSKSSRVYTLELRSSSAQERRFYRTSVVQRFNRVVP